LLNRGDVLVSIDGVPMKGRSMHDVAARLLGVQGSIVMVKFRRQTDMGFVENTIAMDRRPMQLDAIKKVAQSITHV
jgi:C-terminal processing protease CtpA/Prc